MSPKVYSVKELNEFINIILTTEVGEVTVKGEVSGYQIRQNKWISFDLKDNESVVNCFTSVYQVDFPISDGQELIITGTPRIYVPYGKFSFSVRSMELSGEGAIQKAFEELKLKLTAEGMFDVQHKRPLPRFPETIGIITSGEGAAINDIRKVIDGRWGGLNLELYPVVVQGANAPDELVTALNYFNAYHPVDVIIFGRGGGSLEDLQAFNSERVARAIFASRIPIVSGIGHEHNTSIADLVADVRAATPSNAAEITVPDRRTVAEFITRSKAGMAQSIRTELTHHQRSIERLRHRLETVTQSYVQNVRQLIDRIWHHRQQLSYMMSAEKTRLGHIATRLEESIVNCFRRMYELVNHHQQLLSALNPSNILARGYSITYDHRTGKPITQLGQVPRHGTIRTHLHDGSFLSRIDTNPQQESLF